MEGKNLIFGKWAAYESSVTNRERGASEWRGTSVTFKEDGTVETEDYQGGDNGNQDYENRANKFGTYEFLDDESDGTRILINLKLSKKGSEHTGPRGSTNVETEIEDRNSWHCYSRS